MSTDVVLGAGTELRAGDIVGQEASPQVFDIIPEATRINGPNEVAPQVEVTHFQSTRVERISGLPDSGTLTFDINLIPGNPLHQQLRTDLHDGILRNYELQYSDESPVTTDTFQAHVTSISPSLEPNAGNKSTCVLQITDEVDTETV